MKLFNDTTNLLIILLFGCLVYLTIYRGHWVEYLKQTGVNTSNETVLSENITIESTYFIDPDKQRIVVYTDLDITKRCAVVDSLWVSVIEKDRQNSRPLEWIMTSEMNSDSITRSDSLCPGQRMKIQRPFDYSNHDSKEFRVEYFIKEIDKDPLQARIELIRAKKFELRRQNRYDFVILLYPALWIAFGVLILAKFTKLIRKEEKD